MSLFVIHFGLKRRHEHLQHHTVCFGPRYRELIDEIFKRETLADDFSLYLHAPCVTDPSLAPEGCASHYVLAPVPHGHGGYRLGGGGAEVPRPHLRVHGRHYMPGLRGDLVTHRIFTPQDFRDELNAHLGSAFSLEPILTQSAWFRPHNRDDVIPQPLYRRRRHSPGCRRAGRRQFGQGHRRADAGGLHVEGAGRMNDQVIDHSTQAINVGSRASPPRQSCSTSAPARAR